MSKNNQIYYVKGSIPLDYTIIQLPHFFYQIASLPMLSLFYVNSEKKMEVEV